MNKRMPMNIAVAVLILAIMSVYAVKMRGIAKPVAVKSTIQDGARENRRFYGHTYTDKPIDKARLVEIVATESEKTKLQELDTLNDKKKRFGLVCDPMLLFAMDGDGSAHKAWLVRWGGRGVLGFQEVYVSDEGGRLRCRHRESYYKNVYKIPEKELPAVEKMVLRLGGL